MSGFIGELQKQNIRNIIDKIHETFARPIIAYKQGQNVTLITSGGYNALYKKNPDIAKADLNKNSRTVLARINYKILDQDNFYQETSQEKIVIPIGAVMIKVAFVDYEFIKYSKTVELDGKTFGVKSPGKPEGIFGPQYYEFLLIPLES